MYSAAATSYAADASPREYGGKVQPSGYQKLSSRCQRLDKERAEIGKKKGERSAILGMSGATPWLTSRTTVAACCSAACLAAVPTAPALGSRLPPKRQLCPQPPLLLLEGGIGSGGHLAFLHWTLTLRWQAGRVHATDVVDCLAPHGCSLQVGGSGT